MPSSTPAHDAFLSHILPPEPSHTHGRMIVTLSLNASGRAVPTVEFSPPGMFTSGTLYSILPYLIREVEIAQSKVRHEASRQAREIAVAATAATAATAAATTAQGAN